MKSKRRSAEAYAMIVSGRGKAQVFKHKNAKRSKDARKSWQRDHQVNG